MFLSSCLDCISIYCCCHYPHYCQFLAYIGVGSHDCYHSSCFLVSATVRLRGKRTMFSKLLTQGFYIPKNLSSGRMYVFFFCKSQGRQGWELWLTPVTVLIWGLLNLTVAERSEKVEERQCTQRDPEALDKKLPAVPRHWNPCSSMRLANAVTLKPGKPLKSLRARISRQRIFWSRMAIGAYRHESRRSRGGVWYERYRLLCG